VRIVVNHYKASEGDEYYISFQEHSKSKFFSWDFWAYLWFLICYYFMLVVRKKTIYWSGNLNTYQKLLGHCRLRFDPNPGADFIPELKECALIRELHTYGKLTNIGNHQDFHTQHKGYGKRLIQAAEELSRQYKFKKVAIIASIGTREYYKNKCGYHLEGTYMVKYL
jgi:histone acetyltransferase (RNA polymerase elongator complex component)